jgi:hypothetical protein
MSLKEEEMYVHRGTYVARRRKYICTTDGPVAGKNYGIQRRKPNDAFLCMKYGRKKVSFIALRHH